MKTYRPQSPFNVPLEVFIPTTKFVKGVLTKTYPTNGEMIFASFRTFGGTEITSNNVLTVENTAVVETWYRPDITADCRIKTSDGAAYEIIGTPENINQRNQFLKFKIRAIEGGA